MRSWLQPCQSHTKRMWLLPPSIPPFLYPSILNQSLFWPGIWSQFSSFFNLNHIFYSFHLLILSLSLNAYLSLVSIGHTPSLFISLPVYRWVRVSLSYIRPSIRPCMCLSVCPSGRGAPWWRRVRGLSLPAWLVVLSQSLCRTAHFCEALWVRARAHPAFLWLFDLG